MEYKKSRIGMFNMHGMYDECYDECDVSELNVFDGKKENTGGVGWSLMPAFSTLTISGMITGMISGVITIKILTVLTQDT